MRRSLELGRKSLPRFYGRYWGLSLLNTLFIRITSRYAIPKVNLMANQLSKKSSVLLQMEQKGPDIRHEMWQAKEPSQVHIIIQQQKCFTQFYSGNLSLLELVEWPGIYGLNILRRGQSYKHN